MEVVARAIYENGMPPSILTFFTRRVMPRATDVLFQGIVLVALVMVFTSYDFESTAPRRVLGLSFVLAVWIGYNELLRRILTRRATRLESNREELPEGLYPVLREGVYPDFPKGLYPTLTNQCIPNSFDMMLVLAGLSILSASYFPEWFSFLPASVSPHVWTVALLALWFLFYFGFYRLILRQRVRNSYYHYMYRLMMAREA